MILLTGPGRFKFPNLHLIWCQGAKNKKKM